MPTFGLLEEDTRSDENVYVGHDDLFFKRFAFETVQPLQHRVSPIIHATLSRLLCDRSVPHEKPYLSWKHKFSTNSKIADSTPSIKERKKTERIGSPEEIADYYIKRAWEHSEEKPIERIVDIPYDRISKNLSNIGVNNKNETKQSAQDHTQKACDLSKPVISIDVPPSVIPKSLESLEQFYMSEMRLAEKFDKAKKEMEENKDQKSLRILTKRTIVEKVTVESKRTANEWAICAVADFFCKLFKGTQVDGYGEKPLQLTNGNPVYYAYVVTIESYMGIVERDPSLVIVISKILLRICEAIPAFESVLLGKLMRSSQLLTLDEEKCAAFSKQLAAADDRRIMLIPETSTIKLFVNLLISGLGSKRVTHFNDEAVWNFITLLVDEKPRMLATALILLELADSGNAQLTRLYWKRWSNVCNKVTSTVIPNLETAVDQSDVRRDAGEDTIVSSLRHAMLRCSSTILFK